LLSLMRPSVGRVRAATVASRTSLLFFSVFLAITIAAPTSNVFDRWPCCSGSCVSVGQLRSQAAVQLRSRTAFCGLFSRAAFQHEELPTALSILDIRGGLSSSYFSTYQSMALSPRHTRSGGRPHVDVSKATTVNCWWTLSDLSRPATCHVALPIMAVTIIHGNTLQIGLGEVPTPAFTFFVPER